MSLSTELGEQIHTQRGCRPMRLNFDGPSALGKGPAADPPKHPAFGKIEPLGARHARSILLPA